MIGLHLHSERIIRHSQKEQHFAHCAILVQTSAMASVMPKCCAVVAQIITINAIQIIMLRRALKGFRKQSCESNSDKRPPLRRLLLYLGLLIRMSVPWQRQMVS
nr:MAG TPA: hypothetical protein [Caudoviricetes sp.]